MNIKTYLTLQRVSHVSLFPLILAFTNTVSFSDRTDCKAYSHYLYSGSDVYKVVWDGASYPTYCTLRFKMSGSDTYKLCAEVTTYKMECARPGDEERRLEFDIITDKKSYNCHSSLPIQFCNEDLIYMHLEPRYRDIRDSSSTIRITVTATVVSQYGSEYRTSPSIGAIAGVVIGFCILCIIMVTAVICKRRAAARQNTAGVTVQRQGNNVYIATENPYQTNQFTQPSLYQHQQYPGGQNVPLVQNQTGGGAAYPNQYPPMSEGQSSQAGFQAPFNPNYHGGQPDGQSQYSQQNQQPFESKSTASAPPPSYSDVMTKGKDF